MKNVEEVQTFCAIRGIKIHRLKPEQEDYAERLLQKYTWQTSARYIALVCHPKYGSSSNVALLLEDFYDSPEGKDFKEPAEEIKRVENALAKEFDSLFVKENTKTNYPNKAKTPKRSRELTLSEKAEVRQLLTQGTGMQKISDIYNCSKRKVQRIRDSLIEEHPETYQTFAKKNRGESCVKSNIRINIIKKCIFSYPEASFNQIAVISKASHNTVMSVWLKMVENKEIDNLLLKEVDLPNKHFSYHRRLTREEIRWASSKLKQNWKSTSVAYALKIHRNCLLKYLANETCTK